MTYNKSAVESKQQFIHEVLESQNKQLGLVFILLIITIIIPHIITGFFLILSIIGWFKITLLRIKLEDKP